MSKPLFICGQKVLAGPLRRKAVILERAGRTSWKVAIGSITLTCRSSELEIVAEQKAVKLPAYLKEPQIKISCRARPARAHRIEIDLHGLSVTDALSLAESALSDAVLSNLAQVDLIHGLGTGKLKNALHHFLAGQKIVHHFMLDPLNYGMTRVYL